MKKKIILLGRYNNSEILNGPEKFSIRIFQLLLKKNYNAIFIDFFFKDRINATFLNRLFGFETLDDSVFRIGIIRLIVYLLRQNETIIHIANLERYQLIIFLLKKIFNLKIITTFHASIKYELSNSNYPFNWLQKLKLTLLEKLAVLRSDYIVFASTLLKDIFLSYYKIQNKNYEVIYNGIDDAFYEDSSHIRVGQSLKVVFYNSSKYVNRDLKNVYKALSEINDANIELFIIGDDEDYIFSNNNLKVKVVPYINQIELINFLRDKHIFIKGKAFDSFSLFAAECMAKGMIVIVTKNTGISELINNYINGIIYNHYDEIKLIVKRLYTDDSLFKDISRNAQKIYYKLNWEHTLNRYSNLYDRL